MRTAGRARSEGTVDLRRARRRRRTRLPRLRVWVPLFVLAGGAVWATLSLRVDEVRVSGAKTVPPDLVVRMAALQGGERILLTRTSPIRRRVESLPSVRRATVSRRLLSRSLLVTVEEREALVRLEQKPELVADKQGRLFTAPAGVQIATLQDAVRRPAAGGALPASARATLAAYSELPAELRGEAATIRARPGFVVTLKDGTEIRVGRPERMRAKGAAAATVLADARRRSVRLAYVDVRSPLTPVVGERVATPAPVASARPGAKPAARPGASARPRTPAPTRAPSAAPTRRPSPAPTPRPATPRPALTTPRP